MSSILNQVRKAIEAGDKTRYWLWKQTGIPQSQLCRLMAGQEGLSVERLERLAAALGLEFELKPAKTRRRKKKES